MDFPCLVYKSASNHRLVRDGEQLDAALDEGWFETVPEALAGKRAAPPPTPDAADDAPPTRAELEAKAAELGIEFHPRLGDAKLAALIADKLAKA